MNPIGKGTRKQLRVALAGAKGVKTGMRKVRENLTFGPPEFQREAEDLFVQARDLAADIARLCAKTREHNRKARAAAAEEAVTHA